MKIAVSGNHDRLADALQLAGVEELVIHHNRSLDDWATMLEDFEPELVIVTPGTSPAHQAHALRMGIPTLEIHE